VLRSSYRYVWTVVICALLGASAAAQQTTSKVTLDSSETLFSVIAAISHCGYAPDAGTAQRKQVLAEIAVAAGNSEQARTASREICVFYADHRQPDPNRDLAQYVSLALNMGEAPKFDLKVKEADVPPDANYVLGFRPLLVEFAKSVGLHDIWSKHEPEYSALIESYHSPVTNMLLATDVYLRLPMSSYLGRAFTVYVEPMEAPGPVNARNYGADYFLTVSPTAANLRLDDIRHTYLHFMIDPLIRKRSSTMKRLQPLLTTISSAPLPDDFKHDIALLTEESLIRAIEARLAGRNKKDEVSREAEVNRSMAEGYILSRYFFEQLTKFETDATGFQDALGDFLYNLDVDHEKKRAQAQQFTTRAAPEVLAQNRPALGPLDMAEQRFVAGDYDTARALAQQALNDKTGDAGRALFLLAQLSLNRDIEGAKGYFAKSIDASKDPHIVAWSHIYLGRIADIQGERETALTHYKAALGAGDPQPQTKQAAERGISKAYEPPREAKKKESN
jgi:tetratricopeptide (TPR) repeat protein